MDETHELVIQAQRDDGSGFVAPVWQIRASIINRTTGAIRMITSNDDLSRTMKGLSPNDKVTLDVVSNGLTVPFVFEGLRGRDLQTTFGEMLSVVAAALDGSLLNAVSQIRSASQRQRLAEYANELALDLKSIAQNGRTVKISPDSSIEGYAKYIMHMNPDGTPYGNSHVIKVNPNLIGSGRNDRLSVSFIHELFHIVEGDGTSVDADYARFGVNEVTHQAAYDKAAMKLISLSRGLQLEVGVQVNEGAIRGIDGSAGADGLAMASSDRAVFIEGYEGNDVLSARFSDSVLDGGSGDDRYVLSGGVGKLAIFDTSGYDTIDFGASTPRSQLVVRLDEGWVELGINTSGASNVTTADLSNVVVIPAISYESNSVEQVLIGGQAISMSALITEANSAPFFTMSPEIEARSTFRGGYLTWLKGNDLDGHSVSFSVVSASGYASNNNWLVSGGRLWVGAPAPATASTTDLVLRVSDGKKYVDAPFIVRWAAYSDVSTDTPPQGTNTLSSAPALATQTSVMDASSLRLVEAMATFGVPRSAYHITPQFSHDTAALSQWSASSRLASSMHKMQGI